MSAEKTYAYEVAVTSGLDECWWTQGIWSNYAAAREFVLERADPDDDNPYRNFADCDENDDMCIAVIRRRPVDQWSGAGDAVCQALWRDDWDNHEGGWRLVGMDERQEVTP